MSPLSALASGFERASDSDSAATPLATAPSLDRPWIIVAGALLETGGQDRANLALAEYLAANGRAVHLVAHRIEARLETHPTARFHQVARPLNADVVGEMLLRRSGARLAHQLNRQRPFVLSNGGNCDWPGINWVHYVHAAYDRGGEHGAWRRFRFRISHGRWLKEERRALRRARLIVANSERTKRDICRHLDLPAERVRVIYYGIDSNNFRAPRPGERQVTRTDMGWPTDRPVMLFIGALADKRKGLDTVVNAWRVLAKRRSIDPLLVVIGRGALLDEWRRRVASEGLERSVTFLGFRNDVPRLIRAADGLIAPTRYEAYGLGVHEALCCELPAIVSANAGVAERYPSTLASLLLPDAEDDVELANRVDHCLTSAAQFAVPMAQFATLLRSRTWADMAHDIVASAGDLRADPMAS